MAMMRPATLSRFWLQDQVARWPSLLKLSYRLSSRRADHLIAANTDLMIEGFPRSANTFAAWAFELTNPRCKLAHHVHTRAHVLLAVRQKVPAVVLLRPPADAVRSLLVRRPEMPPRVALSRYIAFYEGVAPHTQHLIFARFDTVINDYDLLISTVNRRFGTQFQSFSGGVDKQRVFEAIDEANRRGHGGHINPRFVPRPHPERERLKAFTPLPEDDSLLRSAETIHHYLAGKAI